MPPELMFGKRLLDGSPSLRAQLILHIAVTERVTLCYGEDVVPCAPQPENDIVKVTDE